MLTLFSIAFRQLFFVLYLEYLLWRTSKSMLDVILYVDKRKQEGAFAKNKLIFPGSKTIVSARARYSHDVAYLSVVQMDQIYFRQRRF